MQPAFKQRLSKQVPVEINKLATIKEQVFYVVRATTVDMQRRGKHAFLKTEAVFSAQSVSRGYKKGKKIV
jgi:hypothetical protein